MFYIEDAFTDYDRKDTYSFLNDDFSKYFAIFQQTTSSVVLAINSTNGSLMEAKRITYPEASISNTSTSYCGKLSDNKLLVSFLSTNDYHYIDILNTDNWDQLSYNTTGNRILYKASPIFNTDQVALFYGGATNFRLQTAYNKLNYTEIFTQ